MAERAGDTNLLESTVLRECRLEADDRIPLEQLLRSPGAERIVDDELCEVELLHVDFEPKPQGFRRLDPFVNELEQARRVRPELLVPERVVAKDFAALHLELGSRRGLRGAMTSSDHCQGRQPPEHRAPYGACPGTKQGEGHRHSRLRHRRPLWLINQRRRKTQSRLYRAYASTLPIDQSGMGVLSPLRSGGFPVVLSK